MNQETVSEKYEHLLTRCQDLEAIPTAVAHPCDEISLFAAVEAARRGLIVPILVGPAARIASTARLAGIDLGCHQIVDVPHSRASAAKSVELVRKGEVELLMKGSLQPDELMSAVLSPDGGLRTSRRISHVFVMDIPNYHKLLFVTDGAINIAPTLEDKARICQNAIDLALSLGLEKPKVAILAAVEKVTSRVPATVDAAALCKMVDRGQITGGTLDGPFSFDNAISNQAARAKGIRSEVPGDADILLMPDLESASLLATQLTFLADAGCAGLMLGAKVLVILTNPTDSVKCRISSCAIAMLATHARRQTGERLMAYVS